MCFSNRFRVFFLKIYGNVFLVRNLLVVSTLSVLVVYVSQTVTVIIVLAILVTLINGSIVLHLHLHVLLEVVSSVHAMRSQARTFVGVWYATMVLFRLVDLLRANRAIRPWDLRLTARAHSVDVRLAPAIFMVPAICATVGMNRGSTWMSAPPAPWARRPSRVFARRVRLEHTRTRLHRPIARSATRANPQTV